MKDMQHLRHNAVWQTNLLVDLLTCVLFSQRLNTRPSLSNSLPHCDQYDRRLRPPPSTSHVAGLTPVLSQSTTCDRTGCCFRVAFILSLDSGSTLTEWINVASSSCSAKWYFPMSGERVHLHFHAVVQSDVPPQSRNHSAFLASEQPDPWGS